jgi:hypothetical protein
LKFFDDLSFVFYNLQMKYRINKIKREHSIVDGGLKALDKLVKDEKITSIIPGPIKKSRTFSRMTLFFQYKTKTGDKYLLKGNGAVQEVFVIKKDCDQDNI